MGQELGDLYRGASNAPAIHGLRRSNCEDLRHFSTSITRYVFQIKAAVRASFVKRVRGTRVCKVQISASKIFLLRADTTR